MEILAETELKLRLEEIINKIKKGALFIHPTDTIYGIGCKALDAKAVAKVREIKDRTDSPFSVLIPSLSWLRDNCKINEKTQEWISRLPGPYTLIVPLQNKSAVARNVNPALDKIGVRYPEHWFSEIVEKCGFPIVTTSANKAGQPFMTSVEDLDPEIKPEIEFIIYEGPKKGRPSKIVDVEKEEVRER